MLLLCTFAFSMTLLAEQSFSKKVEKQGYEYCFTVEHSDDVVLVATLVAKPEVNWRTESLQKKYQTKTLFIAVRSKTLTRTDYLFDYGLRC